MADRVKYFLLGLLFLVVISAIAYDVWTGRDLEPADGENTASLSVRPGDTPPNATPPEEQPRPVPPTPNVRPKPKPVIPPVRPNTDPVRPKPVVPNFPPTPKPARERVHVVKANETLGEISTQYYGTYKGVAWIVEANGLKNANVIFKDQKLRIPAARKTSRNKTDGKSKRTAATKTVPTEYTVRAGEDLYTICRKYFGTKGEGARVSRIMELNDLWSAKVAKGTVIRLKE